MAKKYYAIVRRGNMIYIGYTNGLSKDEVKGRLSSFLYVLGIMTESEAKRVFGSNITKIPHLLDVYRLLGI